MLFGLAYRILGARADAEDAVQDTYLKWSAADRSKIENPASWLTTACTRRCIDMLRAAHKSRVDYIGTWLPEPIHSPAAENPEEHLMLVSSLQTAFLLVLERLTPKERAAYLLHEIFDVPYPEVAEALNIQETTCRKLVSRAKANIDQSKVRHVTPIERQNRLLSAFEAAISGGGTDRLTALLSDDIQLCADSGGKASAIGRILEGKEEVLAFIVEGLGKFWGTYEKEETDLNGVRGFVVRQAGVVQASVSFAFDEEGALTNIYIMRNPDKLAGLA